MVTTAKRDRVADLDLLPSPVLTGLFDAFMKGWEQVAGPAQGPRRLAYNCVVVLETNRGCPYGCTFCDWGSATLSRIRKFDLDRIFAELEWCARNQFETIGIADANFGIFERDVEIAQQHRRAQGHLRLPEASSATTTPRTRSSTCRKIIEIFTEAGIVAEGKMSHADASTPARSTPSSARTSRWRSTTSCRSSSAATACRCRSIS